MEKYLHVDITHAQNFFDESKLLDMQKEITAASLTLHNKTGKGNDYVGWVDLPDQYDREEFKRILQAARKIRKQAKVLLVIGIGGSYLGAKAAIEMLTPYFPTRQKIEIIFAGNQMSSTYLSELMEYVKDKSFAINIISKSGTTTEPAIAFRFFKKILETKYGAEEAGERIYVTTDKSIGALKKLAEENHYATFVVPNDIGGRYSVLTAVGLLPIAVAGIDIKAMMQGAKDARKHYKAKNIKDNDVYLYAATRNLLYREGKSVEMLVNYEPKLAFFSEWWKQLFGESEGKNRQGLFVSSANFSTDLHSLGQYIQDGQRIMFETVINIEKSERELNIEKEPQNNDGLNYLADKTVDFVNKRAFEGTLIAHEEGGVPNLVITIPEINAYSFGYMIYFFELACGISGYVLGVNPFDQPGVEAYKRNMFALLGKPGYETLQAKLEAKLKK
ncbi:MAG: glucose-6-phosphate isomerase [Candidatus Izemoplasmatales bacterium]|jgi:glucose-6-phosphate isomerase